MLDQGPVEKNVISQALRFGEPIPERIQNAPELIEGLQIFIQAFFDLDAERTHALSLTPIPWRAINEWGDAYSFCGEQKEDLLFFVRKMDNAHLQRLNKKGGNK